MEMEERRNKKEQRETGGKHGGSKRGFSNMRDFSIMGLPLRVCQVKCVNFFEFIWRSVFDRHIYTIKSNQMVVLRHCDTLHIKVTYHDL